MGHIRARTWYRRDTVEHYLTRIQIHKLEHLTDVDLSLSEKKANLILTGKNGSGKTRVLEAIKESLLALSSGKREEARALLPAFFGEEGIQLTFCGEEDLYACFREGRFITAYYPAGRLLQAEAAHGEEKAERKRFYTVDEYPVKDLNRYLVYLKIQQAFALKENNGAVYALISDWFSQFEAALRNLMDEETITVECDYEDYAIVLKREGRCPISLHELSAGYSAAVYIFADILLRMDRNWLSRMQPMDRSLEGIVLIDEVEAHLHPDLQGRILPFLTERFPGVQFVVTTHSPFVVNSLDGAVIYDLDTKVLIKGGLTDVTYSGIVEGYFHASEYSMSLQKRFQRYKELTGKETLTGEEEEELAGLEQDLDGIPSYLCPGIAEEYSRLKLEFRNRVGFRE